MVENLISIFKTANSKMMYRDKDLFESRVSEQTFCGALMLQLFLTLKSSRYKEYFVDVEYNRNKNGKLKTHLKTFNGPDYKIVRIKCDLIVHSRGNNIQQDNLIALEMKKSTQSVKSKNDDRLRVQTLTKDSYDDVWSFDGKTLPKHVCRYALGIFYEINFARKRILIEYYVKGEFLRKEYIDY